ncbi:MAG: nucleotidyltransferase domain-containing protein [Caldilineaceae bacterium]
MSMVDSGAGPLDFAALARRFDGTGVRAIVLLGSHARGEAGPYSDVDLQRLVDGAPGELPPGDSHLIDGHLVVVGTVTPAEVAAWFTEPQQATHIVLGLQSAQMLIDRDNYFAQIQARARAFRWDDAMQAKANIYASAQMVGWIEEAHKALQGLMYDDVGRLLLGRFGLSWGLLGLVKVQRGIMLTTENEMLTRVMGSVGTDTEWARLCRTAFGLHETGQPPPSVHDEVRAGLRLYVETVELLANAIQPEHALLIDQTVERIESFL